jgi:hypothetical protein
VRPLQVLFTANLLLINSNQQPPPHVYIGLQTPQPFKWHISHIPQVPATVGWRFPQVPPISSALRSIFGFARQIRPPMGIAAAGTPSPYTRACTASRIPPPPLAVEYTQVPPISSPCGSIFSFVRQIRPPMGIPAPGPSSPSTRACTTSRIPPPPLAGGYTQVPPISSPCGSIFGYAR